MAKQLTGDEEPFSRHKYNWGDWTDGEVWLIERESDYSCSDKAFQVTVYAYARRTGLKARTEKHPDGLVIQFTRKAPTARRKLRRKRP